MAVIVHKDITRVKIGQGEHKWTSSIPAINKIWQKPPKGGKRAELRATTRIVMNGVWLMAHAIILAGEHFENLGFYRAVCEVLLITRNVLVNS